MYLITTKNIFSTKLITDELNRIYSEHNITVIGLKFIKLNSIIGIPPIFNTVLKEHATKVLLKHKVGKSTRYNKIL